MMAGAACSRPAPRLVYVKDEYQTMANVRYLPGCTWLHRCSDDVGCCQDESKTCSPSHIETVSLPFFVSTLCMKESASTINVSVHKSFELQEIIILLSVFVEFLFSPEKLLTNVSVKLLFRNPPSHF